MEYKEKLEEAKKLYETANADQKYVLESLFPELKEPDDEKIRKELIKGISKTRPNTPFLDTNITREEAIDWLEKQGQKETTYDKEMLGAIEYCKKNNRPLEKEHIAWLEKQGEQKHDDETSIAIKNEEAYKIGFSDGEAHAKEEMESSWSEEDEEYINDLIGVFDGQQYQAHSDEEIVKWLKSIRLPYNKEWDENDEEMLRSIIATCEVAEQDRDSSPARHLFETQANWLKTLRPQNTWKPSDEQLYWLKWAVNRMPDTEKANEAEAVLEELLEQLKKLREE